MNIDSISAMYPKDTKIRLLKMKDEPQMPKGLTGTVNFIDDIGQIHMNWENGSTLALNIDKDSFEKIIQDSLQTKEAKKKHKNICAEIQNLLGITLGQTVYLILKYNGHAYTTAVDHITQIAISKQGVFIKTRSHSQYNKQYKIGSNAFLSKEECNAAYQSQKENAT